MKLQLQANPEEVMRAVEALQELGRERGLSEKEIFGVALALEECGSNIVNHALGRNAAKSFWVSFDFSGDQLRIELRDDGPEFDPTLPRPPRAENDDDRPPGGWGIQLVRNHTDHMVYRREDGENILLLTRQFLRHTPTGCVNTDSTPTHKTDEAAHVMPLEIEILKNLGPKNTGAATVKLNGSLDTATAPELERRLAPVLAESITDLVYDLANLKFISSAGLRVFSTTRKVLKERGGQASFINMQPQIQEVFEIMKSLPGVAIFKDVAELDRYLAVRQRAHQEKQ
jgi:anti-sigma B factor antagonist